MPSIPLLGEDDAFHDSSLVDVQVHPNLTEMRIVLSTPDTGGNQRLWMILLTGVLRIEFETTGDGRPSATPIEVYSVHRLPDSPELERWRDRRGRVLPRTAELHHIVFASSFIRGWGEKSSLEGVEVICQSWSVEPAPRDYLGSEFVRPRIEGTPKDDA